MGIKGWLAIGGAVLSGAAVWLGLKKKEDEHYDKIQRLIRDVDRKEPEKEETTEKIIDDIEKSFREMGLDDEADAYVAASKTIIDAIAKEMGTTSEKLVEHGEKELEKLKGMSVDELMKAQEEFDKQNSHATVVDNRDILEAAKQRKEDEQKMKELQDKMNDPEWQAEQERLRKEAEEKKEATWKRKVKKAIEQKNFRTLEDLFDQKYAGGPWHPSPASVFGDACRDGVITDDFYHMAAEYFGKLWCYSGD